MYFCCDKRIHLCYMQIDSVNKQGLLLEVVQVLTDMNLIILKGYISSDAGWFMDGIIFTPFLSLLIYTPCHINWDRDSNNYPN